MGELSKRRWNLVFGVLLLAVSAAGLFSSPTVSGLISYTTITSTLFQTRTFTSISNSFSTTITTTTSKTVSFTKTISLRNIGYIGCSNTQDSVLGYQSIMNGFSNNPNATDAFWDPYDTFSGSLDQWTSLSTTPPASTNPTGPYWTEYQQEVAKYGQPQIVWVETCETTKTKLAFNTVQTALSILRSFSPNATVYISPLNTYNPVGLCPETGLNGVQDATNLTNQAVAAGLGLPGPIMGPLTNSTILSSTDTCHPNTAGRVLLGHQLVAFFNGARTIGYIGCSNTQDSIIGYQLVVPNATQKLFWNPYETTGGSLDKWDNASSVYWTQYDQQVATYGQPTKVWVQICEDTTHPLSYSNVTRALSLLRQHSPNAVFYISPLNSYSPVGLCPITGSKGVQDATQLGIKAVQAGLALKGPLLGPLTTHTTISDDCQPNTQGQQILGSQLKNFFNH